MREVVTGDLVFKAMLHRGLEAELLYIADDFDPLRKVYPFLSEEYAQYVGQPVCDIPCPCGDHSNYAEHYLAPFLAAIHQMDIHPEVIRGSEQYRSGAYTEEISLVLKNRSIIREILERVSGRTLPSTWSPFYPICGACRRISNAEILDHDPDRHQVTYRCTCGQVGIADYSRGEGKLVWRVDWPMRWSHFGVTIEPFGKDHAASGGSYDTGKEIARTIFGRDPPFPVMYEWISLKGKGTMASSTGVAVTIGDMLEIVPPDVLRYLIARSRPERAIDFDPGLGLLGLIDEYERIAQEGGSREYVLSRITSLTHDIPFRHMVTVVQIAQSRDQICQILARSGYDVHDEGEILGQARRAAVWLEKYAPDPVKFQVQESLPETVYSLPTAEISALESVIAHYMRLGEWKADELHNTIYVVADSTGVNPKKIFSAIYSVILGKQRGPRLGWFLEALGRDFVIRRLSEAVNVRVE